MQPNPASFSSRQMTHILKEDIAGENSLSAPEKMKTSSDILDQWESELSKTAAPFIPAPPNKKIVREFGKP
jgi:hypothetical protein